GCSWLRARAVGIAGLLRGHNRAGAGWRHAAGGRHSFHRIIPAAPPGSDRSSGSIPTFGERVKRRRTLNYGELLNYAAPEALIVVTALGVLLIDLTTMRESPLRARKRAGAALTALGAVVA